MSAQEAAEKAHSKVFDWLKQTPYAASSLESLTGGNANFVYRARLVTPLPDGTTDVIVKHGEPYMARFPQNKLTTTRCDVEAQCLELVNSIELRSNKAKAGSFVVRSPRLYLYDKETNMQIQEYLPRPLNLKEYALKNFSSPSQSSLRPDAFQLGKLLAEYIVAFSRKSKKEVDDWVARGREGPQPDLFAALQGNKDMQALKHFINYDWCIRRAEEYPEIFKDTKEVFAEMKQRALEELERPAEDMDVIHGDWATVNVLLSDVPLQESTETTVLAVDWENGQLGSQSADHGEMLGEIYALWLYRRIDAGLWLMQGYAEGLQLESQQLAWTVALRTGIHLVAFGTIAPGWGTPAQVEDVARVGRDIILNAWNRNREWFEGTDLACLFTKV